jgi:NAD(P)-dependent dehydrogenase (short-subunit alcohol dehydrogenase family)
VVIHCHRSLAAARALAAELERARARNPPRSLPAICSTPKQLPALIGEAHQRFAALHLLVNNASSFYPTPLGAITLAQWDDLIGTNLRAPLLLAQAAAPELRRTQGALLNIVDIHGQRPLRDHVVYSVAKAGLIMLTRALARELAPEVRVNAIAPGAGALARCPDARGAQAEDHRQDAVAPPRCARGHRARGAVLRQRRTVRDRPDPGGRRRSQHRLVVLPIRRH